jgi:predicted Zn-dependent protease
LESIVPELRHARALWQANRFDEALSLFEAAAKKYPQNLVALVDGSRALGARFEIQRAETMLNRLCKLAGQRPDILHLVGQTYRMIFRPAEAMECFQRVLKTTRDIPDAYLELAVLYERRHRLDEAYSLIQECLQSAPDYLEAYLFKARLLRRIGQATESDQLLHQLAGNDRANPLVRAQASAEIAQKLDREEDYRGAMQAMLQCKQILREREAPVLHEAEVVMDQLRRLTDALTPAHFLRWSEASSGFEPVKAAVLTSFPRSGTTLLEQVLDSHSGLVSSDEREAFARDIFPAMWLTPATPAPTAAALDAVPPDKLGALRRRYFDYMAAALNEPIGDRVHLDKEPTSYSGASWISSAPAGSPALDRFA